MIVGGEETEQYLSSLKVGAIRLNAVFDATFSLERPISATHYAEIRDYVRQHAIRTTRQVRRFEFTRAFGSSGTITALATIAARDRGVEAAMTLTLTELRRVAELLHGLPVEERRKIQGSTPSGPTSSSRARPSSRR